MPEETTPKPEAKAAAAKGKSAAPKKPKEPALEDKPFTEFVTEHFIPTLKAALVKQGLEDIELTFTQEKLPIVGMSSTESYWQLIGKWQQGQRQFNLYFLEENIKGQKAFSYATNGVQPSILESFMIDERKVTLDLLLLYTLQRLNGQKWLVRN